jgi:hypothetical protein
MGELLREPGAGAGAKPRCGVVALSCRDRETLAPQTDAAPLVASATGPALDDWQASDASSPPLLRTPQRSSVGKPGFHRSASFDRRRNARLSTIGTHSARIAGPSTSPDAYVTWGWRKLPGGANTGTKLAHGYVKRPWPRPVAFAVSRPSSRLRRRDTPANRRTDPRDFYTPGGFPIFFPPRRERRYRLTATIGAAGDWCVPGDVYRHGARAGDLASAREDPCEEQPV